MARSSALPLVTLLLPFSLLACASGGSGPHKEGINPPGSQGSPLFSTAVHTGNLLFLSGVIGRSPEGDIGASTRQSLDSIRDRLALAGATMDDVVKCTVFLVDMADYQGMNEVYVDYFPDTPPARSAIAVRELPVNAQVEIECIAALQ
ncbi:MAG: RidA family protein [Gemmatimonadota bacterium]